MMILETLFPVFALVFLGRIVKITGFAGDAFFSTSDKMVYYIFFPCMLFWKIGGSNTMATLDMGLPLAGLCAVLTIFTASTLYIILGRVPAFQAGTFSQSCYRFNTYIGMAVVLNGLGTEGVVQFSLLIGFVIPVINVLSVSVLIWFSGRQYGFGQRCCKLVKALIANPLILACIAGLLFSRFQTGFPAFIDKTLNLVSMITLPLALLSIGSAFSFSNLRGYFRRSLEASIFKMVLFPFSGVFFMTLFGVGGVSFQTGLIFFSLPTSTALYVLSSQMNSDTDLAAATIVFSTLFSIVSLSAVLFLAC
ncbi:MAG: AEC family transporter [Desulfobacteraceae bacterium]